MAKLVGPLHSAEARGRMGGLIYNTHRGISVAKAFSSPAQPRTSLQLQIRAYSTQLMRLWASIGATAIGQWNAYAAAHAEIDWTGNPKRLTGLNWFLRCNIRLLIGKYPHKTTPPATPAPDALAAFAAADGVNQSILTWTPTLGTDKTAQIYQVGPHSAGAQAKIERAKSVKSETGEAGTVTITGLLAGTYTFFARSMDEDNGLVSPWVSDLATVTDPVE